MTDLQAEAKKYAKSILNNNDNDTFSRQEMYYALADAYEQGWVDCDMKNDKPETQEAFFGRSTCVFPIVGETEPYVYNPNEKYDWSVHIDLARCTNIQLRFLSELGYFVGDEILRRINEQTKE